MKDPLPTQFQVGRVQIEIHSSKKLASEAAAVKAADILALRPGISSSLRRLIVGTGNSQKDLVQALVRKPSLDWSCIEVFHMDEYLGIAPDHPASFRRWLKTYLADVVEPRAMHYLNGDAADIEQECLRYGELLRSAPIDLCFLGFGENGHIAFNDPVNADFHDPLTVKRVRLDSECRMQQVGEGHFPSLDAVPAEALTVTCPLLISAKYLICCVPESRKAKAVRKALQGPISTACPASLVRPHPHAFVYLDEDSASLLELPVRQS